MQKNCSTPAASERLRAVSAEVLQVLGEKIGQPVCVRDTAGQVLYANSLWSQQFPEWISDGADDECAESARSTSELTVCCADEPGLAPFGSQPSGPAPCGSEGPDLGLCGARAVQYTDVLDEQGQVLAQLCVGTPCNCVHAHAELRNPANLLQSLADNTQDAIYVKDRHGKYIFFNRAATKLVGKPIEDILGHDDRHIFDPEGAARIMSRDQEVIAQGQPQSEMETLTAGGITRSYHATKSPYISVDGEVLGVIGISRDITDQVRANQVLQEKTEFLNAVFQATPECMKILDLDGRVVDMNAYGLAMAQAATLNDVLGKCVFDFITPEDRARYIEFHHRVCAGHYETLEYCSFNLSGKRMICESHSVPIEINNERMHLSITRDITERKQTEKDLYYLWQNAIDPLCIASAAGHFLKVNPAWTKALGWSQEELTTRPWLDFVHPDDQAATIEAGKQLHSGSAVANFENRYRCKDGSYRWFLWSTIPLANTHISYGFVRDVTDIKRLSETIPSSSEVRSDWPTGRWRCA